MRTTPMLVLATMLLAGTATAASACGAQASLKSGVTAATAQDFSAVSKKKKMKMKMTKNTMGSKKMMKKRMTTGGPATKNPAGGPGTGTTPGSKSTSTGNAGTGAGAAGGQAAGTATNSGK